MTIGGGDVGSRREPTYVQAHGGTVEEVQRHLLDSVAAGSGSRCGDLRADGALWRRANPGAGRHDSSGSFDSLEMLRVWLATGCSTARTAEQLDVHANTVTNRLERLADLARLDLHNFKTCMDLQLALSVWDAIHGDGVVPVYPNR
ncbi:helix-turn-helix domain-containing protein [Nocardia xishanensis]|uniref:Helix-turn-helix domain-containing protein n=1 Tax=Nocardia xishanensis TaxID=238964 RepID=A0ABW7X792_9NOCA